MVDPVNNEHPDLAMTSAGWCGKVAIRLAHRLYLLPMLGAGFAVLARHGISLGASIGLSVDLSGIALAIYDAARDLWDRAHARLAVVGGG